jgi:membrane-associated protein
MEKLIPFIQNHAESAHWTLFLLTLLAGINIPISIDLLMILSATLAATIIPESFYKLFFAMLIGCYLSAWVAYWMGRVLGPRLTQNRYFSKLLSPKRIANVRQFYEKKGLMAFVLGRFIPFGVRNVLYMSSGMSAISFYRFALWDAIACTLWSLVTFALYYTLGKNIQVLYPQVKIVNLLIFIGFSVTVIALICYKKKKTAKGNDV